MTRVAALLVVLLLLVSCGDGGGGDGGGAGDRPGAEPLPSRVTTEDEVASLAPPAGWVATSARLDGPVVLAISAPDESEQLFVSTFDRPGDAENAAIFAATGAAQQGGTCKRVERDRTFGAPRLVVDCAFGGDEPFHKVFLVQVDGDRSALLLVQATGKDLADTAPLVTRLLDSWRWS